MDLSIFEKYGLPIVKDFDEFIKYIEEEKPILTPRGIVLGKKACYELNNKLNFKKAVESPNQNQNQYFSIDLYFSLASESGLYVIGNNEKNKLILIKTRRLDRFIELNNYEKYIFILENYWSKNDFDQRYDAIVNAESMYKMFANIAVNKEQKPIYSKEVGRNFFLKPARFLYELYCLGICNLELIEGTINRYEEEIKCVIPTVLGVEVCNKLLEGFKFWNTEDLEYIMVTMNIKKTRLKAKKLFVLLKDIFPEHIVEKTVEMDTGIDTTGVYIFKVTVDEGVWRKIKMSHKHTFYDLHLAIQEALDFDNDHLYEFYVGTNRRTAKQTYSGNPCEGEYDVSIEKVNLYKGQKLGYIFDFGDGWEYGIMVEDIDKTMPLPKSPELIATEGRSPEQYGQWD